MAALTTQRSGNWSDTVAGTTPWTALTGSGTGGVPGAGDTVTIGNGHTVVVDANTTVGSKAAAVGHAVTINGSTSSSYGKLQVADGVTLTLRGFDTTTNTLMLVNRFGWFEPLAGSTIVGDVTGDFSSKIFNKGIISAVGTSGKHITWTVPSGAYSWNNSVVLETSTSGQGLQYEANTISVFRLANNWISNAAGSGAGSFGDGTPTFNVTVGSVTFTTEVSTAAAVTSAGKFYVDYDRGTVYVYGVGANPTIQSSYKYLTLTGTWGIDSTQNTTYNAATFRYCDFRYLGKTSDQELHVLENRYKYSAAANSSSTDRIVEVTNCTFTNCYRPIGNKNLTGTAGDYILFTNNTFNDYRGRLGVYPGVILHQWQPSVYVSYSSNTLNLSYGPFLAYSMYGGVADHTGTKINSNTGKVDTFIYNITPMGTSTGYAVTMSAGQMSSNNIQSDMGVASGSNMIMHFGGNATTEATITDNFFGGSMRAMNVASYLRSERNVWSFFRHHGLIGHASSDDSYITNVIHRNNLHIGGSGDAPYIQFGYNHRFWIDNWTIANNTLCGGGIEFGDVLDLNDNTLITNATVVNNLIVNAVGAATSSPVGIRKPTDTATLRARIHALAIDHNSVYNCDTTYTNITHQATFTNANGRYNFDGTRNILGVALWDSSAASPPSNKSLVFTVTSAGSDETLAWSGGAAVQLIFGTGTATAGGANTLTNSGATWSTSRNSATCPQALWVKITGGTGVGQIRAITNNTATQLTVTPSWTTQPDATSTYSIYQSEVKLFDSGATDYIRAGIDLRSFPTSSKTDTGISVTYDEVLTNPNLPTGSVYTSKIASDHYPPSTSPVVNAGTSQSAPSDDYGGRARPVGAGYDIGFFEFLQSAGGGDGKRRLLGLI